MNNDKEINEIVKRMKGTHFWNFDDVVRLCELADLYPELVKSVDKGFKSIEKVIKKACVLLNVSID